MRFLTIVRNDRKRGCRIFITMTLINSNRGMKMVLSVEINDGRINIVQTSGRGGARKLKCVYEDISRGVEDGNILDVDYVSGKIREILQKNRISIRKTVFVINSKGIVVRRLRLPVLEKRSETRSMIGYELRQSIPYDTFHYRMHYEIISDSDDEKYAWYIIYCIPEDLLEGYKELAKKAKLRAAGFEIYCSCINKLRNMNKGTYAFTDISEKRISLTIMNNGISDLTRAVEADSLSACLDEIIGCIRFYQSIDRESKISRMYIYNSEIKDQLNLFIERMHYSLPDVEIVRSLPVLSDELSHCDGSCFMSALAAFNEGRGSYKLNETRNYERSDFRTVAATAVILVSSLLFIFGGIFAFRLYGEYKYMKEYISNKENILLNNEMEILKEELKTDAKNAADIEALKKRVNEESYIDSEIFNAIFSVIPEKTSLHSMHVSVSGVSVDCTSQSIDEAAVFMGSLRALSAFADIFVNEIEKGNADGGYDYTVQCVLKDVQP